MPKQCIMVGELWWALWLMPVRIFFLPRELCYVSRAQRPSAGFYIMSMTDSSVVLLPIWVIWPGLIICYCIGKYVNIVSFWFLWFLADSRLNRENFNANPKICAQLVVTNGKIEIHRHAPRWREVLNSRKVVDLPTASAIAIAIAIAIAHFYFHYSLHHTQGPS